MDIKTIIKKLDISTAWVLFLRIFGGKSSVYDYILEKAESAVNVLLEANAGTVESVREKMAVINSLLRKFTGLLPDAWIPYAEHINAAFLSVYDASADNQINSDEGKAIVEAFRVAVSDWKRA